MTNLGHQSCTGSVSKCSEIRIVEAKKKSFLFYGKNGTACHTFHSSFVVYVYYGVGSDIEKDEYFNCQNDLILSFLKIKINF